VGGCPIGSIASELADNDPRARETLVESFERWEAPIRDGLTRMRERGELRSDADTDTLALALLTALQGGLLLTQTRRNTEPLRAGLDTVLAQVRTYATT
jgi:TetR/AcrR family transcriptional regulator, transcriptional repressor for nem operon